MKKLNNKGFSLVELIIVIAVMAALIGILSPQYIRYVERSRVTADNVTIDEIMSAAEIVLADNQNLRDGTSVIILSSNAVPDTNGDALNLAAELVDSIPNFATLRLTSNTYETTPVTITVTVNSATDTYTVVDNRP